MKRWGDFVLGGDAMKKLWIVMNCLIVVILNANQLNAAWHIERIDTSHLIGDFEKGS